ncbi:MAG TPA: GTP 3',8-cyclase MoaA [Polyangia bacterium]|nr:GTP 3',8-cyclase MoaA [Polyangia bacterium]
MDVEEAPLVDRQARTIDYLRVSVTDRCNYRCSYCVPADGAARHGRAALLSFEQIAALVRIFVGLGVRRVRLTGGEPTARRDLPALVRLLRAIVGLEEIALSTNGHLLAGLAGPLREAGVDRLNVSLDSLDADKFRRITRGGDLGRVLAGIEAARAAGFRSIKLNTVAIKGFNDDEVAALCRFAWTGALVPRFIEEMPMAAGRTYLPGSCLTAAEIRARVAAIDPAARVVEDDGGAARGAGPARYFRLADPTAAPAVGTRRFGIISPMTEHFCDGCNRLRLSATGAVHACLGYDDAVDLRAPLEAGDLAGVRAAIRGALAGKRDGHAFDLVGLGGPRKAMVQIGG